MNLRAQVCSEVHTDATVRPLWSAAVKKGAWHWNVVDNPVYEAVGLRLDDEPQKREKTELARLSYVRTHALVADAHEGIRCVTCLSDLICCATINIVMTGIVARFMFWAFSCVSVTGAAASRWRPL